MGTSERMRLSGMVRKVSPIVSRARVQVKIVRLGMRSVRVVFKSAARYLMLILTGTLGSFSYFSESIPSTDLNTVS